MTPTTKASQAVRHDDGTQMIGHQEMLDMICTEYAEAICEDMTTPQDRADAIIKDILVNHLPRIKEGLEKGYVDENQILILYDHAVRARILSEHSKDWEKLLPSAEHIQEIYSQPCSPNPTT